MESELTISVCRLPFFQNLDAYPNVQAIEAALTAFYAGESGTARREVGNRARYVNISD